MHLIDAKDNSHTAVRLLLARQVSLVEHLFWIEATYCQVASPQATRLLAGMSQPSFSQACEHPVSGS